jgi:hypothetical protein
MKTLYNHFYPELPNKTNHKQNPQLAAWRRWPSG